MTEASMYGILQELKLDKHKTMPETTSPLSFEGMNEQALREVFLAPLLARLGYAYNGDNRILHNETLQLRYPKEFIGRPNRSKDRVLVGIPDYILEVRGYGRWILEAKHPDHHLTDEDVWQARSYATHPEVGAHFYAISNGNVTCVYQANLPPENAMLISIGAEELASEPHKLSNLLSPDGIRRHCTPTIIDLERPLASGRKSKTSIIGGTFGFDTIRCSDPTMGAAQQVLTQMSFTIIGDNCQRNPDGRISARIRSHMPFKSQQDLAAQLGIDSFEVLTGDDEISADADNPTGFQSETIFVVPEGKQLFDLNAGKELTLPIDIEIRCLMDALGHLDGNQFLGRCFAKYDYTLLGVPDGLGIPNRYEIFASGPFSVTVQD